MYELKKDDHTEYTYMGRTLKTITLHFINFVIFANEKKSLFNGNKNKNMKKA